MNNQYKFTKKSYFKKVTLFVSAIFLMTSCLEIRETVKLNTDGTGTYSFVLDMSQLKELFMASRTMAKNMMSDSLKRKGYVVKSPNPIDQLKPKFDAIKVEIESIKGIRNYQTVYDSVNFRIGAQFDFDNEKALNLAINTIQKKKEEVAAGVEKHFFYKEKFFERLNTISSSDLQNFQAKDSLSNSMASKIKYSVEYLFDKKIKEYSNMGYYKSGDGKSVIFSAYLNDLIKGESTIANKITF